MNNEGKVMLFEGQLLVYLLLKSTLAFIASLKRLIEEAFVPLIHRQPDINSLSSNTPNISEVETRLHPSPRGEATDSGCFC